MKKKLVSYLILACSVFGLAMVGSCKDYEDEFKGFRTEIDALGTNGGTLKSRIDSVSNAVQALKSCTCDPNLKKRLDSLYTYLGSIASDSIANAGGLSMVLNNMNQQIAKAASKAYADSIDSALGKRIDSLQCFWPDELYKAYVKSHLVHDSLRLINDSVRLFRDSVAIDSIIKKLDILSAEHAKFVDSITLADSIKAVEARYKKADSIIMDTLRVVAKRLDAIADSVHALWLRVDTLKLRVDSLMDAENKRITSLYVQGAVNPIFGSFALPVGIRSNILGTYYGTALKSSKFPATSSDDLSAVYKVGMELTAAEKAVLGSISQVSVAANDVLISDSANNAGRMFITINPNEVQLDSTYKFKFVTSDGNETKATIGELTASTEKLTFGYKTRAGEASTGFYEAAVKIEADDADALAPKFAVTKEQLKNIAKDVVSFKDGFGLTSVAGAVFKLAQTQLDANAVKVTWTDSLGEHNVTSQYDVAVTAIQPLSYTALDGIGTSKRLPTISPLTDLSVNLNIGPSAINLSDITFNVDSAQATISFDTIIINKTGVVKVKVRQPYQIVNVGGTNQLLYKDTTYTAAGLDSVLINVEKSFNTNIVKWGKDVNKSIGNIMGQINGQVDNLISQIGGKMNNEIDNMMTKVQNSINNSLNGYSSYFDKMNSLINKVNSLTSRINGKLSLDGSAFLQPMLAYEAADGSLHPMSNDEAVPSVFTDNGGGIILYPTSYTADLLAPAYKKFIAVVDYKDANGNPDASKAAAANNNEYLNKVIDGGRYAIPFAPADKGTYTIYYSAIDYSGFITAVRFYVTVK